MVPMLRETPPSISRNRYAARPNCLDVHRDPSYETNRHARSSVSRRLPRNSLRAWPTLALMDGTRGHNYPPKTSQLAPMAPADATKLTRASAYLVLRPRLGVVGWASLSPVAWLVESLLHRRYAAALRARGVDVPAALTQWWRAR